VPNNCTHICKTLNGTKTCHIVAKCNKGGNHKVFGT
jgi:hypothetical protein